MTMGKKNHHHCAYFLKYKQYHISILYFYLLLVKFETTYTLGLLNILGYREIKNNKTRVKKIPLEPIYS